MGYETNPSYLYLALCIVLIDNLIVIPLASLRYRGKALQYIGIKLLNIFYFIALNIFLLTCLPRLSNYDFVQFFYINSWQPGYIFFANASASVLSFLLLVKSIPKFYSLQHFNLQLGKRMLRYSLPIIVAAFAAIIHQTADKFFLKYLLPKEIQTHSLGIYGACAKLAVFITLFTQAFRLAAEPFFFGKSKSKNANDIYALTMNYFVLVLGFIYVVLCCNLAWIKKFISQPAYWEGLDVVPILLLSNLFLAVYVNLSIWYKVSDKTKYGAYISLIGVFVTISMNLLLIPNIGYIGAALSTLATYTVMMLISYALNQAKHPIPYQKKHFLLYIGSAALLGGMGYVFFINSIWVRIVFPLIFLSIAVWSEKTKWKHQNIGII